jgi:phosphoglycolate phosphatase
MSFDFLIFDLDGTLVDSQKDLTSAVNFVRDYYGFDAVSADEVRSYLGSGAAALLDKVLPHKKGLLREDALEIFKSYYAQHLMDNTVLFDGVKETLELLKDKTKAVLSNKNENFCVEILKRLGIYKYFAEVFGGDTSGAKKPNPKPVLDLIKLTNSNLSKTVIVGDSANDFLVAKNAAITSIAVEYGYSNLKQIKSFNPNFIVSDIKQIIGIVY